MCYASKFDIIIRHASERQARMHLENYIVQKREEEETQCNLREPWHGEEPCEGSEDNLEPSERRASAEMCFSRN